MAKEYEIVKDENGFLVSRKIKNNIEKTECFSMYIDEERGDLGRFMDAESSGEKPYQPEPLGFNLDKDLVPIGTVVATDPLTLNLKMIIGYNYKNPDNNQVYDYIACNYPNDELQ